MLSRIPEFRYDWIMKRYHDQEHCAHCFYLNQVTARAVRNSALRRHDTGLRELGAYFDLLLRLADGAEAERRGDLFDRIERVIAETHRRRLIPVRY
jgi:5-carboxymethyl-2-hydroxymuconate isomerase